MAGAVGELELLRQQMALASEFRVPLPGHPVGGYGEIVVCRERTGSDRWAVTDGALTGLRAWVAGEGWKYVSDVGRKVAYAHERGEALALARQVAEFEAACYGAEIDALRAQDQDGEP